MLSRRCVCSALLLFGLGFCALALALWPSRAYAYQVDIAEGVKRFRWSEYEDIKWNEIDANYVESHYADTSAYLTWEQNLADHIEGFYDSDEIWIDPLGTIKEGFVSGNISGYTSSIANNAVTLSYVWSSTAVAEGAKVRIVMPYNGLAMYTYSNSSWDTGTTITPLLKGVYMGPDMGHLEECSLQGDYYIAPANSRCVVLLVGTSARTLARLEKTHRYSYTGRIQINLTVPDEDFTTLGDQLTDTSGSGNVVPNVVDGQQQQVENLQFHQVVQQVSEQISTAMNTSESDATVSFPGLSYAGFVLPAVEVDPWDYLPDFRDEVRWATTLCFVIAFLHHIYALFQAIFGIWEYGLGVDDWGMDEYRPAYRVEKWHPDPSWPSSGDADVPF